MKGLLIASLCLVLTGCVKYVDVPVWVCPEPNMPKREQLKSAQITKDANTDTILRSFTYDIVYLSIYADQLETILLGYKRKAMPVLK